MLAGVLRADGVARARLLQADGDRPHQAVVATALAGVLLPVPAVVTTQVLLPPVAAVVAGVPDIKLAKQLAGLDIAPPLVLLPAEAGVAADGVARLPLPVVTATVVRPLHLPVEVPTTAMMMAVGLQSMKPHQQMKLQLHLQQQKLQLMQILASAG